MFKISITDLRTNQTETFSADLEKGHKIKKMLVPVQKVRSKKKSKTKNTVLVPDPEEFRNVVRVDMSGSSTVEDVSFIEVMNGQRPEKLHPTDTFTSESKDVYEVEPGDFALKVHLDPTNNGGQRVRMIKLVAQ